MKVDRVLQLNKQFELNNWNGFWKSESNFSLLKIKSWKYPVMISAPHAVNHIREGQMLWADLLTWWLAVYLQEQCFVHCITSQSFLIWDPNYDKTSEYKENLLTYTKEHNIRFLIDLHGCWSHRNFSIEFWTWGKDHPNLHGNKKLLNLIRNSINKDLKSYFEHVWKGLTINNMFPASSERTVSCFIANHAKIPTLQLEINKNLRDVNQKEQLWKLITALENLINQLIMFLSY